VPGRLLLLATSPRVAPGLLSWSAWSVLHEADEVYAATSDHPLRDVLATAGVTVTVSPSQSTDGVADFLRGRAEQASVVWLVAPEGDPELADRLGVSALTDHTGGLAEVMSGSWDLRGARLLDLVAVMDRLRSSGGCPWDAGQTHESLLPYLLEETYETVEAIETADLVGLREELGDLLLQVVFHARVAEEHVAHPWSIDDVADGIVTKLVSRHPHVFAGADPGDADALEQSWEALKRAEKSRTSVVDGVPLAQPALALAAKLIGRAAKAGVVVPLADPATVPGNAAADRSPDEEVGAVLLAMVAQAHTAGVDPEAALRAAARSYAAEVRAAEVRAAGVRAMREPDATPTGEIASAP
jgi:XTP/dITP diphosphohydrolase